MASLYDFIGVERTATLAQIKKAYFKQALICHPDKCPDDPDAKSKFQKLSHAHSVRRLSYYEDKQSFFDSIPLSFVCIDPLQPRTTSRLRRDRDSRRRGRRGRRGWRQRWRRSALGGIFSAAVSGSDAGEDRVVRRRVPRLRGGEGPYLAGLSRQQRSAHASTPSYRARGLFRRARNADTDSAHA
jgi:curved DNA-binding protein CbpA